MSAPVFIPFLGAAILLKEQPQDVWREFKVAAAGPILGSLGALAVLGIYGLTDRDFWLALAFIGFFLNLFNLAPVWQLDGRPDDLGDPPSLWIPGLAGLAVLLWFFPSPILIIVVFLGALQAWDWWRHRGEPREPALLRDPAGEAHHRRGDLPRAGRRPRGAHERDVHRARALGRTHLVATRDREIFEQPHDTQPARTRRDRRRVPDRLRGRQARREPAVTIFGSARVAEGHRSYAQARTVGRLFAEAGFAVVTGGGGGADGGGETGAARRAAASPSASTSSSPTNRSRTRTSTSSTPSTTSTRAR